MSDTSSSRTGAYFGLSTVSEPTMLPSAMPMAPMSAAAPPPPGAGASEASTSANFLQLSSTASVI